MDPFDPKGLALPNGDKGSLASQKPPRHRRGEKFLKGPIPWGWLTEAAKQPGHAFHIGIALWHLSFMKRKKTVILSGKLLKDLKVDRFAGYRALTALEKAGLVSVERHRGRCPVVTILDLKT